MWKTLETVAMKVFMTLTALWVLTLMVWVSLVLLGVIDITHLQGC